MARPERLSSIPISPERTEAARRLIRLMRQIRKYEDRLETFGLKLNHRPWDSIRSVVLDLVGVPREGSQKAKTNRQKPPTTHDILEDGFDRGVYLRVVSSIVNLDGFWWDKKKVRGESAFQRLIREALNLRAIGYQDPLQSKEGGQ